MSEKIVSELPSAALSLSLGTDDWTLHNLTVECRAQSEAAAIDGVRQLVELALAYSNSSVEVRKNGVRKSM